MPTLSTVASFGFPDLHTAALLKLFRRMGCVTCQFYRNVNNPPDPADALRMVANAGLRIDSIHGVFGPEHDPSSPDESTRRAAVETYRREGELALRLGGPMVVVHPAPMAANTAPPTPQSRAARVDLLRRSMEELAPIGERTGVTYLFENIPPNNPFGCDSPQLAAMIRQVNHGHIQMCFDTGHAHMVAPVPAALEPCLPVVKYLHVHDNDSKTDSHEIPGHGTIKWDETAKVMAKLPASVPAMLELFQSEAVFEKEIADGLPGKLRRWLAAQQPHALRRSRRLLSRRNCRGDLPRSRRSILLKNWRSPMPTIDATCFTGSAVRVSNCRARSTRQRRK